MRKGRKEGLGLNDNNRGVTMHMHIAAQRHPIPDCPAIYLIEPTSNNLKAITNDLKQELYTPAYVNFLSSVPRPLLEEFASEAAMTGTSEHIAQVFDQYLNFVVAEPDLFSLNMQKEHTYHALNSPKTTEEQLNHLIDKIISGLFSVVATMGMLGNFRWVGL
jgi:sec1 family domain-containing protein 1